MAGQAFAVTPLKARGDAFSDFANGVGASTAATSPNAGKACTGTVQNLKMQGTCTANGKCGINVPPNEVDQVASADCA